jgi:hypothetical protein
MEADVFSREANGLIALRITQDEFNELLMVLGYKTAEITHNDDGPMFKIALRVINRLNAGNPDFIPYQVPAEAHAGHVE